MPPTDPILSPAQIEQFLDRGFVTLPDCFPPERAQELTDRAFQRLGCAKDDPQTWEQSRVHMPTLESFEVPAFAPKAWQAMCQLLGGEERIQQPSAWGDAFIVNFRDGADRPWEGPSAQTRGWHKDGDFFRHFLDRPEQGLLPLVLWSDIEPQGGGTFFATDSVPVVARFLADHPEGVLPNEFPFRDLISQCRNFAECTGKAGDVVLLHPFVLHASSQNHSGRPRFLTNPPVTLAEPMQFNRPAPEAHSPVEQAILRALGMDRLDFRAAGPRERVIPERWRLQQQRLEEEKKRLASAS